MLSQLLTGSGRAFENTRYCVEPLNWADTPADWGKQPYVKWIEKEAKETEIEYAVRSAKLGSTHGLARGWRQLGLRSMTPFDGIDNSSRMWILKHTPSLWNMDEIETFLTNAGFTDVVWYSRQKAWKGVSWTFPRQKNGF